MKKLLICIFTLLFSCGLYAQDISVKNGWQLLGAIEDINISKFDNSCVDVVWKYDSSNSSFPQWELHIANGQTYEIPSTTSTLISLNQDDGFWLKGNDICEINTTIISDTNDSETQIEDNSTITHNGFTYETVISPFTSEVWLDRNLGASQVCTSTDDTYCYGYYYQWGRLGDGHQLSSSTTTDTQATDITNAGTDFILSTSSTNSYDWAKSADGDGALRNSQWSVLDGSGICPIGFRVPNTDELKAETVNASIPVASGIDAFENFLKLPAAGYLNNNTKDMFNQGAFGFVWTSSPDGVYAFGLNFSSSYADFFSLSRARGMGVRCIKDDTVPSNNVPIFTSSNTVNVNENQTTVLTVNATDTSVITYSLSGTDGSSFDINSSSGEITFISAPLYATQSSYSISVTATNSSGNEAVLNITVNVNEPTTIINSDGSITFMGKIYETVVSPFTSEVWLDRNLGAEQVCSSSSDSACYGDYYQWGRLGDGHQISTSSHTTTLATSITNAGSDFILAQSFNTYDWVQDSDSDGALRNIQWSLTNGSGICPTGFRVPTENELKAETVNLSGSDDVQNTSDAYSSFLKFPASGYRDNTTGTLYDQGTHVGIWSSTGTNTSYPKYLYASSTAALSGTSNRSYGYAVRCLKD